MKYRGLLSILALSSVNVAAQLPPVGGMLAPNPIADPFAANSRLELPPLPPMKPPGVELPITPLPTNTPALPPGLRVILIRDKGQGLLGSAEVGAFSIVVTHGKPVRIAGQNYYAEVTQTEIKLYLSSKGKLIWEGSLAGVTPLSAQADASQIKYIPPLSAGVNPGLKSTAASSGTASQPMIKAPGTP